MSWWQESALAVGGGLLVFWLALVGVLAVVGRGRDRAALGEGMRLLPDVIRLLRRLAADRSVPRGVRIRLGLLLAYLLMPIDLVPDFIPVIGYADDAIIVAIGLAPRGPCRRRGGDRRSLAGHRHRPGRPAPPCGPARPETRTVRSGHEQADEPTRARHPSAIRVHESFVARPGAMRLKGRAIAVRSQAGSDSAPSTRWVGPGQPIPVWASVVRSKFRTA